MMRSRTDGRHSDAGVGSVSETSRATARHAPGTPPQRFQDQVEGCVAACGRRSSRIAATATGVAKVANPFTSAK